jgi:hypothetical protein
LGAGADGTTTLTAALTVPAGVILVVPEGKTLATTASYALTVNGTLTLTGTGAITGKLVVDGATVTAATQPTVGTLTVKNGGTVSVGGYAYVGTSGIYSVGASSEFEIAAITSDGTGYTVKAGTVTVNGTLGDQTETIGANDTLTVAANATLAIAPAATLTVNGLLTVTGTINVNGTITYGTDDATNVVHTPGSKYVYSSTANASLTNAYIGGTDSTWTLTSPALFTEIAGTTDGDGKKSDWEHEISGGIATLNTSGNYVLGSGGDTPPDVKSLTVTGSGVLKVGTTSATVVKIVNGGILKLDAFTNISSDASQGRLSLNSVAGAAGEDASEVDGETGKVTVGETDYTVKFKGNISGLDATKLTVS